MRAKNKIRKTASIVAILTFAFFAIASGGSEESKPVSDATSAVPVGETLKTEYFEITVNKVEISDRVSTGNEFGDLAPEEGNKFLIINTTFKNIDKESRMITDGTVWIDYNGQNYEFDNSETIMIEGWGTMLDQLNPLTTKTTNLVYKLPSEITGTAYFQPGRSSKNDLINLGVIE